jgi:TonB family protein
MGNININKKSVISYLCVLTLFYPFATQDDFIRMGMFCALIMFYPFATRLKIVVMICICLLLLLYTHEINANDNYKDINKLTTVITEESIVYNNDEIDSPSMVIMSFTPTYPIIEFNKVTKGFVELSFVVNEEGSVIDIKVVKAEPKRMFNRSAIRAMSKFTFKPAIHKGKAVIVRMKHIINYEIEKE